MGFTSDWGEGERVGRREKGRGWGGGKQFKGLKRKKRKIIK